MVRTLYIIGLALLALATAFLVNADKTSASPWTGCYVGGAGSYSALVEDGGGFGVEGPGIAAIAGCDLQRDRFVFGGWADYSWLQFDANGDNLNAEGWAAGGRAGYLVVPNNALLYGLVGWSDVDLSGGGDSIGLSGPVVGVGMEVSLGAGLFGGLEYRHAMLEADGFDEQINTDSGLLRVTFKFGSPEQITAPFEGKPLK